MGIPVTQFCNGCEYLKNTEEEQKQNRNLSHICLKYKRKLFHLNYHPNILKLATCRREMEKILKDQERQETEEYNDYLESVKRSNY